MQGARRPTCETHRKAVGSVHQQQNLELADYLREVKACKQKRHGGLEIRVPLRDGE